LASFDQSATNTKVAVGVQPKVTETAIIRCRCKIFWCSCHSFL